MDLVGGDVASGWQVGFRRDERIVTEAGDLSNYHGITDASKSFRLNLHSIRR
jgi:hypothetical protein